MLLIAAIKAKLASYGVKFVNADVVGFNWRKLIAMTSLSDVHERMQLVYVHVKTADGRIHPIKFGMCVNAAGAETRNISRLAMIGVGQKALAFDVPVMSRLVILSPFVLCEHCFYNIAKTLLKSKIILACTDCPVWVPGLRIEPLFSWPDVVRGN